MKNRPVDGHTDMTRLTVVFAILLKRLKWETSIKHLLHEIQVRKNIQLQTLKEFCFKEKYPCFISYQCDNVYIAEKTVKNERKTR